MTLGVHFSKIGLQARDQRESPQGSRSALESMFSRQARTRTTFYKYKRKCCSPCAIQLDDDGSRFKLSTPIIRFAPNQKGPIRRISINLSLIISSFLMLNPTLISRLESSHYRQLNGFDHDVRWPAKQFNLMIRNDNRSQQLDHHQRSILFAFLDQINQLTCIQVSLLGHSASQAFENFVQVELAPRANSHFIGLSSLGCVRRGRQLLVLTESAFEYPEILLKFHLLRSLGIKDLERPDRMSSQTTGRPIGQNGERGKVPVYSLFAPQNDPDSTYPVEYLSSEEIAKLKSLYECANFQSKLSPQSLSKSDEAENERTLHNGANHEPESISSLDYDKPDRIISQPLGLRGCKRIRAQSMSKSEPNECEDENEKLIRKETGQLSNMDDEQEVGYPPNDATAASKLESSSKAMILKLDSHLAKDPLFREANQLRLSRPLSSSSSASFDARCLKASYRSQDEANNHQMAARDNTSTGASSPSSPSLSDVMMISFEQTTDGSKQVNKQIQAVKVCSCQCQTMSGAHSSGPPTQPTNELTTATTPKDWPPISTSTTTTTTSSTTASSRLPTTSTRHEPQTTHSYPTSSDQPTTATTTTTISTTTTGPDDNNTDWNLDCESQLEWAKPNKSLYESSSVVWDLDSGNENYFICQSEYQGHLIPGKTNGFRCKISLNGKSLELKEFNVLTKRESLNVAWVQKEKFLLIKTKTTTKTGDRLPGIKNIKSQPLKVKSGDKTFNVNQNSPVIGGHSSRRAGRQAEVNYLVARCLLRDQSNDLITLIGYTREPTETEGELNSGQKQSLRNGFFPFDDIQIECSQYDILTCVS